MENYTDADRNVFESTIQGLHADIANAGVHITIDVRTRQLYAERIRAMADELRQQAESGKITWRQAASQAQEARNAIMTIFRSRSTPVGRAIAERLKSQGKTLNELIARYTVEMYGRPVNFQKMSSSAQNAVYARIVTSAGRSRVEITQLMHRLSRAGRGLLVLSLALSIYAIATAEHKAAVARRELAVTGAGISGGIAGGALAGLACGPAAPICVTVGAFAGGALAAFGVDFLW